MTYAVIRFGGRQFKVSEGDKFQTMRQYSTNNEVLMYSDGKELEIGTPTLENYEVKLNKLEDKRDKKIRVGRFKSKSRYRKVKGHKQPISVFEVEKISKKGSKAEKKVEKEVVVKEEKKVEKKEVKKRGRPAKKKEESN
ncbi:50S ribosomal protein L21 [Patescibacteria group bacterium]